MYQMSFQVLTKKGPTVCRKPLMKSPHQLRTSAMLKQIEGSSKICCRSHPLRGNLREGPHPMVLQDMRPRRSGGARDDQPPWYGEEKRRGEQRSACSPRARECKSCELFLAGLADETVLNDTEEPRQIRAFNQKSWTRINSLPNARTDGEV